MLSALAFLTVVGTGRPPDASTMRWFPVVGAAIGGTLALVWLGAEEVWSAPVAAALVVAVDLAITGMLHLDGLADSADGLLPHLARERRLAVMTAPDIGAFALGVVPTVLLLRWASLAGDRVEPLALIGVWAASRAIAGVIPSVVPYARDHGLASPFLAGASPWIGLALVPAAALLLLAHGILGIASLAAAVGGGAAVVTLARHRIGGFTGDVLGAAIVVAETTALLVLAAA